VATRDILAEGCLQVDSPEISALADGWVSRCIGGVGGSGGPVNSFSVAGERKWGIDSVSVACRVGVLITGARCDVCGKQMRLPQIRLLMDIWIRRCAGSLTVAFIATLSPA